MYCLKCGRDTGGQQVFCAQCLSEMEKSPVPPDTPVQLPVRPMEQKRPPARRKAKPTVEERLARTKKALCWLVGCMLVLILAFGVTVAALTQTIRTQREQSAYGRNFSTVGTANGTGTAAGGGT